MRPWADGSAGTISSVTVVTGIGGQVYNAYERVYFNPKGVPNRKIKTKSEVEVLV